jgi:hypothetical protein
MVRQAKALRRVTMAPRPNHTREKSLAQQTEQGPDLDYQRLGMLYELVVGLNPPTGVDRQHESRESQSLYSSASQLAPALRLEFIGCAT